MPRRIVLTGSYILLFIAVIGAGYVVLDKRARTEANVISLDAPSLAVFQDQCTQKGGEYRERWFYGVVAVKYNQCGIERARDGRRLCSSSDRREKAFSDCWRCQFGATCGLAAGDFGPEQCRCAEYHTLYQLNILPTDTSTSEQYCTGNTLSDCLGEVVEIVGRTADLGSRGQKVLEAEWGEWRLAEVFVRDDNFRQGEKIRIRGRVAQGPSGDMYISEMWHAYLPEDRFPGTLTCDDSYQCLLKDMQCDMSVCKVQNTEGQMIDPPDRALYNTSNRICVNKQCACICENYARF